jgi:hypothetical protein
MDDEDQERNIFFIRLILIKYSKSEFVHQYDDELLILLSILYIREFSMYDIYSCSEVVLLDAHRLVMLSLGSWYV